MSFTYYTCLPCIRNCDNLVGMYEHFTEGSLKAYTLALEEAKRAGYKHIESEHILLGLIGEGEGRASRILRDSGLRLGSLRASIEKNPSEKDEFTFFEKLVPVMVQMVNTKNAKNLIEKAWKEASTREHKCVCTEHLLIGLLNDGGESVFELIESQGVSVEELRKSVAEELSLM